MKIAFIGLGNMGAPMARNLVRAGHELTVWNRTAAKSGPLKSEGAKVSSSPGEAAKAAEVVITMLADDHAVESAVLLSGGVLESLPRGATHVSMSTISVALSHRLAEEHGKRGHHYIAAPVFGRPEAAEAGKLFIAAAGEKRAIENCRPVLEAMGQRVFVVGDQPEMANVVKLSGNFLIAAVIESLGEAIALVRKYGIDPHEYVDFLTSSLFAAPVYKTYGGLIADAQHEKAGFALRLGLKDIRLALAAAESVDAPLPVASLVRDHMLAAIGRGREKHDWSVLGQLAAEDAGLK
ncbi:MAG: NAD(P)-dependent oxidoreductase [Candidatus Korobacteraceae bacterium]|jgi:3-hydroxyisobutyrate dehydrogenase-like beta-hydroxyacid dehydrogenase